MIAISIAIAATTTIAIKITIIMKCYESGVPVECLSKESSELHKAIRKIYLAYLGYSGSKTLCSKPPKFGTLKI